MTLNVKTAKNIVGGLSAPSKMPCHGYSIPATRCIVGAKLRKVVGSTCSKCYALKGRYVFPNVVDALERRFQSLRDPLWVKAMAFLINRYESGKSGYFRWHDAGDLQSVGHLQLIVDVCNASPTVQHWLPSREYNTVRKYLATVGAFPANLTVRLSAHMMGDYNLPKIDGVVWSTVGPDAPSSMHTCPAPKQGGICGDCRACWGGNDVNYLPH